MDASYIALLSSAAGGLAGAGAVLAFRLGIRARPAEPAPSRGAVSDPVPQGVIDVLAVLRSSTILLDVSDTVVRAGSAAYSSGLVRGERLTSDALRQVVRRTRRDGEIRELELDLPRGPLGGETIPVSVRVAPLGSDLVLVLVEDATEARRVDAVRRDFVANVSHELKTPVGALILLAEAVLGASDDPEAIRRFATRMQYESSRLSNLVQELIDLSRLQGHDPLREAHEVPIEDVVAEATERCRLAATAKDISLVTGGARGLAVLGDRAQLVTAVRNLVDNAVSYSPEHTRVAIGVRRQGELVEISVTDQGIGIPEAELERVFERFYRVDPARSRATGGTGLGLSIVKHIVANHGGEVTLWSVEGSGSTFTVRLPIGPYDPSSARSQAGGGAVALPPLEHHLQPEASS